MPAHVAGASEQFPVAVVYVAAIVRVPQVHTSGPPRWYGIGRWQFGNHAVGVAGVNVHSDIAHAAGNDAYRDYRCAAQLDYNVNVRRGSSARTGRRVYR